MHPLLNQYLFRIVVVTLAQCPAELVPGPRLFTDKSEEAVQSTLNRFYSSIVVYELTRQWITEEGDFDFDFSWITHKSSIAELKEWAVTGFESTFGVRPDAFRILQR